MLQLTNITKSYTTASFTQTALDDVSISFRENEFVAILGPSGSGKTTMLNIVGGLDQYDSGDLLVDGVSTKEYKDRDWDTYRNNRIGFIFQSYNLIPHQTVLANVELALTLSGVGRAERRQRATDALIRVGLGDHIKKRPSQLSGGQMQRVAVARALINDPEILLADEPTGALDSTTSVQIMELLTDIAKERLVIMVTHNPELAETYATRTINLRDGQVTHDSDPFELEAGMDVLPQKSIRRASMSFLTAIALSFNNLMTKKGRTIMTAFAGSIGIIGIAAILSLANGVNGYIKNIEEETLSLYPLTINSTGFDMSSIFSGMGMGGNDSGESADTTESDANDGDDVLIPETRMASSIISGVQNNDLASLKKYLDDSDNPVHDHVNMISYDYGVTPLIYSNETTTTQRQLNPNTSISSMLSGGALSGSLGEMGSLITNSSTVNSFFPMLDSLSMLESSYDVVAGKWATEADECVLVLGHGGGVTDFILYAMGLRDQAEFDEMVRAILNNEDFEVAGEAYKFTPEELMTPTFKIVNRADTYTYDSDHEIWVSRTEDSAFMQNLVKDGTVLRIVGIVEAAEGATATTLQPGLAYSPRLQEYLIEEARDSAVVRAQLADPELNILTGRTFAEELDNTQREELDFAALLGIDPEGMSDSFSNAFNFDTSALSGAFDPSALSGAFNLDPSIMGQLPEMDLGQLLGNLNLDINQTELAGLITLLLEDFMTNYLPTAPDPSDFSGSLIAYMNTPAAQAIIAQNIGSVVDVNMLNAQIQAALGAYIMQVMQTVLGSMEAQLTSAMSGMMKNLSANLANAFSFDPNVFADLMAFDVDQEAITALIMSMFSQETNTFESNLRKFDYADFTKPTAISIYPRDFDGKAEVIRILDEYNERMEADGYDEKVITYTDLVGTLMSSVTTIINTIGYVLIAFVSISLVVSSIMIGIITYISVLERKKEIGILRSIGASKGDVGRVFTAETLIVGLAAGLLGVGAVALATIPINIIVLNLTNVPNITILPLNAAAILIAISMFLSFVAGLIPSSAASRRDPVEALRSE